MRPSFVKFRAVAISKADTVSRTVVLKPESRIFCLFPARTRKRFFTKLTLETSTEESHFFSLKLRKVRSLQKQKLDTDTHRSK